MKKHRVLIIASHPVQYAAPLFRLMAQHPQLDILVAYCSLQGAKPGFDPEFMQEIVWDVPLLDGYPWVEVGNLATNARLGSFWGLVNPGLAKLITGGSVDAMIVLTGYMYASFWIALVAAKAKGIPVLFGTDAHGFTPLDGKAWKVGIKQWLLPRIFGLADLVTVPSTAAFRYIHHMGIVESRIQLTPYAVNNNWWIEKARNADRHQVRQQWQVPPDALVVLFCGKLQPWKRPQDVLQAFAQAAVPNAYLVFAGDGPLRSQLKEDVVRLGLSQKVLFTGFVNQSQLPTVYVASDVFVLPSEYEAFGVVVNEAMLCGCPVIVSDQVGANDDLISPGETGMAYPVGNVQALADLLKDLLSNPEQRNSISQQAFQRICEWSPQANVEAVVQGVERVSSIKKGSRSKGESRS